ncbi:MAG: MarR family transcriptional regulator [Nitrospira sp. LK265]|nr:MarR family winged helix-turn-helix transcriptional regulator [Nitrospira sp.]NGZ61242.1 MarR family transcriptional regulator [Nitrospira sp. LK265]
MTALMKIDQDSLPDRLVTGLSKIGLAMKSRAWRRKGRPGIGPLQIQVLTFLRSRPNHSATVSTIARELSVKLPTASEVIRTLEHKRLVRRRRREIDNRVVTVHLTSLGAKAGHVENRWPEILASATENLSVQEQVALLTALVKLIRALQLQGEIPVARMCVSCEHFRPHVYPESDQPHHCGFYNVSFGDQGFRLDCPEYAEASTEQPHNNVEVYKAVSIIQSA